MWIGAGALDRAAWPAPGSRAVVVSSRRVFELHGRAFLAAARARGHPIARAVLVPDGERAKTTAQWRRLQETFVRCRLDRQSLVFALGGGSVGDLAGFAAATYMRGIAVVQIPTTLLAMVDSSVGGKTGINLTAGKNLVGAFHPPVAVIADTVLLRTLPARQFRSGVYEILKCGLIGVPALVGLLERTRGLRRASPAELEQAITESVRLKSRIVSRDERESGERRLLNLGHTVAHALETATNYRTFTHGEAVGWGLEHVAEDSAARGFAAPENAERALTALSAIGARPRLPRSARARGRVLRALARDKKRRGGLVIEPFLSASGRARLRSIEASELRASVGAWLARRASRR